MRRLLWLCVLAACAAEDDIGSDFEVEGDRDIALDEPLVFDEPVEDAEALPADEPEVIELDAVTQRQTHVATYRVLQWNIAGGKVHDCRTAGITAAVRDFVKDHDIDFVSLNEVCPSQYETIHEALRKLWGKDGGRFAAYVGDGKARVVGNAIFSKRNFDTITRRHVGDDKYGARNLLCGRVNALPHLRFCSAHLTPADSKARDQLDRVREQLETWWSDRRDTVLIAGDFNLQPDDPGFNAFYTADANHARHNPNNHGAYHELDDDAPDHCRGYGERSVPHGSGGPCNAGGKIDFIFARKNRIKDDRYGADAMNVPHTCGGACSDHRPVRGFVRAIVDD
jgi:endonuclease/exonuclease/phosphatase family metal-dependent hydrolase